MKKYYDFHLHSCLSPCADNDNTPNNIAGMAKLCGLDMIALTDHNSTANCPAFYQACERYGLIPIAGCELTTSEDIHVVCLFEHLDDAMRFNDALQEHRTPIKNKKEIFGDQFILDGNDEIIGEEEYYLSVATDISLEDAPALIESFNGICYPAHIDRPSNGAIEILGTFPITPYFGLAEINRKEKADALISEYHLEDKTILFSSDAHCLTDIRDAANSIDIANNADTPDGVRAALFEYLKNL